MSDAVAARSERITSHMNKDHKVSACTVRCLLTSMR